MKVIAIPSRGEVIEDHFGQCDHYTIVKVSDNKIVSKEEYATPQGCGCKSGLAAILADRGVGFMIAGSMGQGALNHLTAAGIEVMCGFSGSIDAAVTKHLKGYSGDNAACRHHGHHQQGIGNECNH